MSTLLCVSHPNCAVPFACRNDRHLGRAFDARRPLILGDTVDGLGAVFSPDEWREVYLEVKEVETMLDRLVMWEAQAGGGGGGGGGGESGGSVSPAAPSTNKKKKKKKTRVVTEAQHQDAVQELSDLHTCCDLANDEGDPGTCLPAARVGSAGCLVRNADAVSSLERKSAFPSRTGMGVQVGRDLVNHHVMHASKAGVILSTAYFLLGYRAFERIATRHAARRVKGAPLAIDERTKLATATD